MSRRIWLILVLVVIFPSFGFVCASRVERMEADLGALRVQFEEIQQRVNNDQTHLTEMILRADKKLEEIGELQSKVQANMSQSAVDMTLQMEQDRRTISELRGQLDVQQQKLSQLQDSLQSVLGSMGSTNSGATVVFPADQSGLYQFILQRQQSGDRREELRAGIEEYLKRYPQAEQAESLLGFLPGLYASDKMHREAISASTRYLQQFPKGSKRNEVIYIMGDSGAEIGNCDLAKKSFEALSGIGEARASEALKRLKSRCP